MSLAISTKTPEGLMLFKRFNLSAGDLHLTVGSPRPPSAMSLIPTLNVFSSVNWNVKYTWSCSFRIFVNFSVVIAFFGDYLVSVVFVGTVFYFEIFVSEYDFPSDLPKLLVLINSLFFS